MERVVNLIQEQLPSENTTVNRRAMLLALIGLCCVGFFVADVATPSCFDDPIPGLLSLGIVTAQLTVICVWGTLVRGTFWIRLPWTLLLLVVSWWGFALGIRIESRNASTSAMLAVGLVWMFGFITSYVPLKIAALCFRWQIAQEQPDERSKSQSNYAIRDIMLGTVLLALTLAIGRAMLSGNDISFERAWRASALSEPEPLIATTIYGVVSLLVKLPCIWIGLGETTDKIKSRVVIWVVYCFVLALFEIMVFSAMLGAPGPRAQEVFIGIIISHQLMGAIMLGVCLALRGLGYRLERSVDKQNQQKVMD